MAAAAHGPLVRAPAALRHGGARARAPRRVVGAGLAAPGRRRGALVAVASLHEPLPSRAQEAPAAVPPPPHQADEAGRGNDTAAAAAAAAKTSSAPVVPGKTVRVRFVLKTQCAFGQSLYLVGDDPALGLWDPSNASALEWAEGHDWILERDLPANKLVEFKFLVRDSSGKMHWQNGPNRSFQTGETANTLVVNEDWADAKKQTIEEEEGGVTVGTEEAVVSDDSESKKSIVLEDELKMDDDQEVKEDESIVSQEDVKAASATNASVQGESIKEDEIKPPESTPLEDPELLEELHEKEDMEHVSALCADENYAENNEDDNILPEEGVPVENGLTTAYEHDLLWGWKALQQLLMNLGFKMDTT